VKDQQESSAVGARDRLREVQQAQGAALSAYVSAAAKVDRARAELARCEDAARCALGLLASTTSPAVAADLTGVSVGVVRDALAAHRRDTAAGGQGLAGGDRQAASAVGEAR
jgi:hypothetical protein